MIEWMVANQSLLWKLGAFGALVFVAGLVAVPYLLVRLPADYFVCREARRGDRCVTISGSLLRLGRNVLGAVVLLAGLAMLVLPGPGFLTLLAGVSLLGFPGKRRVIRRLAASAALVAPINRMRRRAGVPPLDFG